MRPAYWIVGGLLVLAVALVTLTMGPSVTPSFVSSPPGQYPLNQGRPQWPSIQSLGLYRPQGDLGSDRVVTHDPADAKFRCGVQPGCALPTVSGSPQYSPSLLDTPLF